MSTREVIAQLDALENVMTTAPLKPCTVQNDSNEMMVANMGADHAGIEHIVTTDYREHGVRPSECNCDPEADAAFFALVRNHWPEISAAWKERA